MINVYNISAKSYFAFTSKKASKIKVFEILQTPANVIKKEEIT